MCDVCDVYMCCVCMCMCVAYSRPRLMLGFTVNCIFTIFMETDRVSQSYQELGNMASLASHLTLGEFFVSISIAVTYWQLPHLPGIYMVSGDPNSGSPTWEASI